MPKIGAAMAADKRVPLISATGSTRMGRKVGEVVGARLGRALLELGGNNAIIVTKNADLDIAIPAIVFGAVGTAGQRCTSTRRVIIEDSMFEEVKNRLLAIYPKLPIGHPLQEGTLVGPLIDADAVKMFSDALTKVQAEGGKLLTGGEVLSRAELARRPLRDARPGGSGKPLPHGAGGNLRAHPLPHQVQRRRGKRH